MPRPSVRIPGVSSAVTPRSATQDFVSYHRSGGALRAAEGTIIRSRTAGDLRTVAAAQLVQRKVGKLRRVAHAPIRGEAVTVRQRETEVCSKLLTIQELRFATFTALAFVV
jgi:hypothetical protein